MRNCFYFYFIYINLFNRRAPLSANIENVSCYNKNRENITIYERSCMIHSRNNPIAIVLFRTWKNFYYRRSNEFVRRFINFLSVNQNLKKINLTNKQKAGKLENKQTIIKQTTRRMS